MKKKIAARKRARRIRLLVSLLFRALLFAAGCLLTVKLLAALSGTGTAAVARVLGALGFAFIGGMVTAVLGFASDKKAARG